MIGAFTRRGALGGASALVLAGPALARAAAPPAAVRVVPVPARHVRLKPSPFADAFAANRRYLMTLDPERLLHNFYASAGIEAPGPAYGGWEARGIAGHSLGHWLSGASLTIANTGDTELAARLDHALGEMARIQAAHGDGYLGGTTVVRDGRVVDGKIVFEEVRRGDIRSGGFDLNGGWVPLYTWHKVHAGLIDAHRLAGNAHALPILIGLAGYMAGVLEALDDGQMQRVLAAEHGGLNDAYADTWALTGDRRWLRLAERIRHRAVLDPLTVEQDRLAGLHANTQIPKVIGLARLHEETGDPAHARAARFFHRTVTGRHSYAIGGNSEREHFGRPGELAARMGETTCEACNSYNMMKLTRHLYAWEPRADWFDYYERVQLNHIMAHQRPDSGAFVYFMPMEAGARRSYSTAEESFWCCVGSGMESHAKHADSIYWTDPEALFVNLYVPSSLDLPERGLALDLDTALPFEGAATVTVRRAPRRATTIALRLPGWARDPSVLLNGAPVEAIRRDGYAVIARRWKAGDSITLTLPMAVTSEPTLDDPNLVAFRRGPLVLAADLGPADAPFDGAAPALVTDAAPAAALAPSGNAFAMRTAAGRTVRLSPFFNQYDRRTAVYFPVFTTERWGRERGAFLAAEAERLALARRTVDTMHLGEMQPERDHEFAADESSAIQLNGRSARVIQQGRSMQMTLRNPGTGGILRVVYWRGDIDRDIAIDVNGQRIAVDRLDGPWAEGFVEVDYPLPEAAAAGSDLAVAFTALRGAATVYEVRTLKAA